MKKTHYLKELALDDLQKIGMKGADVKRIQEWLNLWRYIQPNWLTVISIDGDFGPQTRNAVLGFQKMQQIEEDGIVGPETFTHLSAPMKNAFDEGVQGDFRELVVKYAHQHLANIPRELNHRNEGPWVRAYMDGHQGAAWAWCMGFVQSMLDQAASTLGRDYREIMPHTYSCDIAGNHGLDQGLLVRNADLKNNGEVIAPGDVFLRVRTPYDWIHTGIVTGVEDNWIHTIEGNTNDEGLREGFEVCLRMRNFHEENIDIFKADLP